MEDSWLLTLQQSLAQLVHKQISPTAFLLSYPQPNSPSFKLTLQRSLSVQNLHLVLSQENCALTDSLHSSMLRCFRINAASPGFYFVWNSGALELHTDFRGSDLTTVGMAVDLMARWLLAVMPSVLAEGDQEVLLEPQKTGEVFQRVAEDLHLPDYSLTVTCWRVRLWSTLRFKHQPRVYLTLALRLTHLIGTATTTVEVAGSLQSHPQTTSGELAHGKLKLTESVEFTEAHQVALMLARTVVSFLSTFAQDDEANLPAITGEEEAIRRLLQAEYFDFGEYFLMMERLGVQGKANTESARPVLSFPSGALVRFANEFVYDNAVKLDYTQMSKALRFRIAPVQLPLVRFSKSSKSLTLNTSGLVPAAAHLRSDPRSLPALVSSLTTALGLLKPTGLVVTRLKEAWYTRGSESVFVPTWRGSKCSLAAGEVGNPALFAFTALRKWKLAREITVTWEELIELFPIRPLSTCVEDGKKKVLFEFSENAGSRTPLLHCLEQIHWKVSSALSISSLRSPPTSLTVICDRRDLTTSFSLIKKCEIALGPLTWRKDHSDLLQEVGKALLRAHEAGVSHLMLSPSCIKEAVSDGSVFVTGFKHNLCRIVEKYVKGGVDPSNCAFLDPAVLQYIHWKRLKSPSSHSKRAKYLRYLDERCDVYSFAMLIYYYLSESEPFSYVKNVDTYQGFLENVVALHRKPLISQKFELAHPEFTDALRRSWEAAPLRPSLKELISFLPSFSQYRQTPLIAKPYH